MCVVNLSPSFPPTFLEFKPAGYMSRIPTKPSRRSVDNSDNLTPPWPAADTDTSSGLGIQEKKGKGPARTGTRTVMRSSGSASQTATPLSYSSIDAEDADEEEFEDDDVEEEEDMEDEEDEEDDQLKEPLRIRLDRRGMPVGSHEPTLGRELQKFARRLDPTATPCWHGQTVAAKRALLQRVRAEFEFYGETDELSESWFNTRMSRCVTRVKYQINKLIKEGGAKPADIALQHWEKLVELREDPAVQEKSQIMSSISLGRPSKNGSNWTQSLAAVSALVSLARTILSL